MSRLLLPSVRGVPSIPATTRSTASSISSMVTASLRLLAVKIAASLSKFAKSAPEKPGVRRAIASRDTSGAIFLSRA